MRIQNYNMQTVPSAGKRGYPSHSWFKYRAKWQEEKNLFSLYLTLLPNWTWTQTYFLRTSRIFRLTPDWAHVFTGFGQSLPRTLMFSCFARYSSTSENKQEKHFFFFLGHSHFIRNCKEQISQFWQNRDFSRGWAKQLSLPNHYNTSLETLINWKWGEFYRNNSPIKQTNKMTNH